jgi:phospholipid transport system substrate-binding protein
MMKLLSKVCAIALAACAAVFVNPAMAQEEAPDAMIRRISQEVQTIAKSDAAIQGGNMSRMVSVVEEKILPYVNFERMTSLAAGRFWRQATPEQQKQLIAEFRGLLIYTYSGALSQVRDQKIEFRPLKLDPGATDVEVRSRVIQPQGEPILLNYRVEKTPAGWKMYDVNVMGAWLVEAYKGTFATEIGKNGVDGLIKMLADKNKQLAGRSGK